MLHQHLHMLVFLVQVAADANTAGQVYPDQSLYPADSVPNLVRRINKALQRADQVCSLRPYIAAVSRQCFKTEPPACRLARFHSESAGFLLI